MKSFNGRFTWRSTLGGTLALPVAVLLAVLQGCGTPPQGSGARPPEPTASTRPAEAAGPGASQARTPKDYRRDAASHLYAQQAQRIYKGRLPPMLYAVGVLNVEIDRRGQVQGLQWTRAPRHAPEVMAEIEKMVRAAAPYPAPQHMAKVTYTDVWLWHKSGKFQLDTLTEGQD